MTVIVQPPVASGGTNLSYYNVKDYSATGDGITDDTTAIQAAITACPTGGTVYLPQGLYKLTAALVINKAINFRGVGISPLHGPRSFSPQTINVPLTSPYLAGAVLLQTTAATDAIQIPVAGLPVGLSNFGIRFADAIRWSNTGHGITSLPPLATGGRDIGVISSIWDNITVWGHDGNHYAFRTVNPIYNSFRHLRSYGGGVLYIENYGSGNYGNILVDHIYGQVICAGSSDGIRLIQNNGQLNLLQFNRPQITVDSMSADITAAGAGTPTAATSAQKMFNADSVVKSLTIIQPDFESQIGASYAIPAQAFFMDPAGLMNGVGGEQPFLRPTAYGANRSLTTSLRTKVDVASPNEANLGIYDVTNAKDGPSVAYDLQSGATSTIGLVSRTAPRPSATKADVALDKIGSVFVVSDGTNWSDVAAAPTLGSLSSVAGLVLDANVDAMALADGTLLTTITDASGNSNTFTGSGATRPTYKKSAGNQTLNGKGCALFDGTTSTMTGPLSSSYAAFTDFYVMKVTDITAARIIMGASAGGGIVTTMRSSPNGTFGLDKAGTVSIGSSTYSLVASRWYLVAVRYDGTLLTTRVDSTPMGTATNAQTFTASLTSTLGAAQFKGYIARAVRYSAALTDTQVMSVEKFLRAWGGTN